MDPRITDGMRERSRRPVRNKRYNRRTYSEDKRPPKRLFTPEIKRFLKDWLVRRRDNPYPNRDEKKTLAVQTGLTYIQVCNWFANWRRKLKNSGRESQRKSWGNLIKSYNSQVHGNVEHFSICSEDSIWHEPEVNESTSNGSPNITMRKYDVNTLVSDMNCVNVSSFIEHQQQHNRNSLCSDYKTNSSKYIINDSNDNLFAQNNNTTIQPQFYYSTNEDKEDFNPFAQNSNKYKNHIMEKYLRDCQKPENYLNNYNDVNKPEDEASSRPSMISKWIESAANFRPSENNYLNWTLMKAQKKKCKRIVKTEENINLQHGKEELDAAEALTTLANAHTALKV